MLGRPAHRCLFVSGAGALSGCSVPTCWLWPATSRWPGGQTCRACAAPLRVCYWCDEGSGPHSPPEGKTQLTFGATACPGPPRNSSTESSPELKAAMEYSHRTVALEVSVWALLLASRGPYTAASTYTADGCFRCRGMESSWSDHYVYSIPFTPEIPWCSPSQKSQTRPLMPGCSSRLGAAVSHLGASHQAAAPPYSRTPSQAKSVI